jgi:hypothetical protein
MHAVTANAVHLLPHPKPNGNKLLETACEGIIVGFQSDNRYGNYSGDCLPHSRRGQKMDRSVPFNEEIGCIL